VSERTLRRWLADQDFAAAYRAERLRLVEAATARLQQAAGRAVEVLIAKLKAKKGGDAIRAAIAILDRAVQGVDMMDLAGRVEEIEREQAAEKWRAKAR
jgi:hypothetical protein